MVLFTYLMHRALWFGRPASFQNDGILTAGCRDVQAYWILPAQWAHQAFGEFRANTAASLARNDVQDIKHDVHL